MLWLPIISWWLVVVVGFAEEIVDNIELLKEYLEVGAGLSTRLDGLDNRLTIIT